MPVGNHILSSLASTTESNERKKPIIIDQILFLIDNKEWNSRFQWDIFNACNVFWMVARLKPYFIFLCLFSLKQLHRGSLNSLNIIKLTIWSMFRDCLRYFVDAARVCVCGCWRWMVNGSISFVFIIRAHFIDKQLH